MQNGLTLGVGDRFGHPHTPTPASNRLALSELRRWFVLGSGIVLPDSQPDADDASPLYSKARRRYALLDPTTSASRTLIRVVPTEAAKWSHGLIPAASTIRSTLVGPTRSSTWPWRRADRIRRRSRYSSEGSGSVFRADVAQGFGGAADLIAPLLLRDVKTVVGSSQDRYGAGS